MRKIITMLSCLVCLQMSAQITTYNINRNIICSDTIQPFLAFTNSYGISINGEGRLFSDTALIRVVLVDNRDDEWPVLPNFNSEVVSISIFNAQNFGFNEK